MVRLDRFLVYVDWEDTAPLFCFLQALNADISDHLPLLLSSNVGNHNGGRFQFESVWPKFDDFLQALAAGWQCDAAITHPLHRLQALLHNTGKHLQTWGAKRVGSVKQQLLIAREVVGQLDLAQESRLLSDDEFTLRHDLKAKALGLASLERTIARRRAKVHWLREGDANTTFFHLRASYRRRKNFIAALHSNSAVLTSHQEKAQALYEHFLAIMGTEEQRTRSIHLSDIGLHVHDLGHLDLPFSEDEIWEAIKSMPSDRAPGPDGFSMIFYKKAWPIIRHDMTCAVTAINNLDRRGLAGLNTSLITLLPKKTDAITPRDYCLISLIHCFAKIVTKTMAHRLAPELTSMVHPSQSAFIKERFIHDNFKLVHATTKIFKQKSIPRVLLKLDIAKAFNSVSWPFLVQLFQHIGFGLRWRNWVAIILATSSTRVLLNGRPGRPIRLRRGLRQGALCHRSSS